MRKILGVAFAAALVSVPVGLASPPAGHPTTNPRHTVSPAVGKHGAKPCPKPPRHGVKYIIRGVVSSEVAVVGGKNVFQLDVTSLNAHAKKALAGPTARGGGAYSATIPVEVDSCTFITKNKTGSFRRKKAALKIGDRVIVGWKAKRGTAYVDLDAADRIVDRGPKPTPAS